MRNAGNKYVGMYTATVTCLVIALCSQLSALSSVLCSLSPCAFFVVVQGQVSALSALPGCKWCLIEYVTAGKDDGGGVKSSRMS